MKFLLFMISVAMLISSQSSIAEDKSSGCGLGQMIAPRKTLISTSTAGTTDGFSWHTRSSAMTSGTSGCAEHSLVIAKHKREHFISTNIDSLKYESALGTGDHLVALGNIYGCPSNVMNDFSNTMKMHYGDIFSSSTVSRVQGSIDSYVASESSLAGCTL